ncbi:MAG: hypothetical protein M1828_007430 [Chrysothrix sp. TS-e1954]|nr:MAG: hypothetical protein M1828_007430 [Chrysothrix sp. TS-e1954]
MAGTRIKTLTKTSKDSLAGTRGSSLAGTSARSLASQARDCRTDFHATLKLPGSALDANLRQGNVQSLCDELGRFQIWCGNIGALRKGPSSLDDRLSIKEAAPLAKQIEGVLADLDSSLLEVLAIASGQRLQKKGDDNLNDFDGQFSEGSSADSDDDEVTEHANDELTLLLETINESVTALLRYSIAIRKASSQDIFRKAARKVAWDPIFDINHVTEKWPKLRDSPWLASRLGKSTTVRRQFFHYRSQHREHLSRDDEEVVKIDVAQSQSERTKATTIIPEDIASPNLLDDVESDAGFSTTTYDTVVGDDSVRLLRVPPAPPESVDATPFECPFCLRIITVKGDISWNCLRTSNDPSIDQCPFCDQWNPQSTFTTTKTAPSVKAFRSHLGRHLEQLALRALPKSAQVEDEQEEDTDSNRSNVSEDPGSLAVGAKTSQSSSGFGAVERPIMHEEESADGHEYDEPLSGNDEANPDRVSTLSLFEASNFFDAEPSTQEPPDALSPAQTISTPSFESEPLSADVISTKVDGGLTQTPLVPPSAYVDFLRQLSPRLMSPMSTGLLGNEESDQSLKDPIQESLEHVERQRLTNQSSTGSKTRASSLDEREEAVQDVTGETNVDADWNEGLGRRTPMLGTEGPHGLAETHKELIARVSRSQWRRSEVDANEADIEVDLETDADKAHETRMITQGQDEAAEATREKVEHTSNQTKVSDRQAEPAIKHQMYGDLFAKHTTQPDVPTLQSRSQSNVTSEQRLAAFCLQKNLGLPSYQVLADSRGGRGAYSCVVLVQGNQFHARSWFNGNEQMQAREDAAEVAWLRLMAGTSGYLDTDEQSRQTRFDPSSHKSTKREPAFESLTKQHGETSRSSRSQTPPMSSKNEVEQSLNQNLPKNRSTPERAGKLQDSNHKQSERSRTIQIFISTEDCKAHMEFAHGFKQQHSSLTNIWDSNETNWQATERDLGRGKWRSGAADELGEKKSGGVEEALLESTEGATRHLSDDEKGYESTSKPASSQQMARNNSLGDELATAMRTQREMIVHEEAEYAQIAHEEAVKEATQATEHARTTQEEATYILSARQGDVEDTIFFKDALGRKFKFPWHRCNTWMAKALISQAFFDLDVEKYAEEQQYDLIGPHGIILPNAWDASIQPGWIVTMVMWPGVAEEQRKLPEPTVMSKAYSTSDANAPKQPLPRADNHARRDGRDAETKTLSTDQINDGKEQKNEETAMLERYEGESKSKAKAVEEAEKQAVEQCQGLKEPDPEEEPYFNTSDNEDDDLAAHVGAERPQPTEQKQKDRTEDVDENEEWEDYKRIVSDEHQDKDIDVGEATASSQSTNDWECQMCALGFKSLANLKHHKTMDHRILMCKVSTCQDTAVSPVDPQLGHGSRFRNRNVAVRSVHLSNRCPFEHCWMVFDSKTRRDEHKARNHVGASVLDQRRKETIKPQAQNDEETAVEKPPRTITSTSPSELSTRPYSCPGCPFRSKSVVELLEHKGRRHENDFGCKVSMCPMWAAQMGGHINLDHQVCRYHTDHLYFDASCRKVFSHASQCQMHSMHAHGTMRRPEQQPITKEQEDRNKNLKGAVAAKIYRVHDIEPTCPGCGERFDRDLDLLTHKRNSHNNVFWCWVRSCRNKAVELDSYNTMLDHRVCSAHEHNLCRAFICLKVFDTRLQCEEHMRMEHHLLTPGDAD